MLTSKGKSFQELLSSCFFNHLLHIHVLVTVILGNHILATEPSISRQNTGRKSKQIIAADGNISHSDSHSKLEVMRLQQLPRLIMSSLDFKAGKNLEFFVNLSHPELTSSWWRATDMPARFPLAFPFRQQPEQNCTLPLKMTVWTRPFQKGKSLQHDSRYSQSSLYIDWFQLPIRGLLIEKFDTPVIARKIHQHIFTDCCDKPASMFWLKLINSIYALMTI